MTTGATVPNFIELRRRQWYAVYDLPADAQAVFGKRRMVQSLKTESRSTALLRASGIVTGWKLQVEKLRAGSNDPVEREAVFWRTQLDNANGDDRDVIHDALLDKVSSIYDADEYDHNPTAPEYQKAKRLYDVAVGKLVSTDDKLDAWLASVTLGDKQKDMYRSDVLRMKKRFPYLQDIHKKDVIAWVAELTKDGALKKKTVQRIMSACRGYWSYLQDVDLVSKVQEPFHGVVKGVKKTSGNAALDKWLPFEPAQVVSLLEAAIAKEDAQLADLIRMGMWTGCRIEELCALKVEKVGSGFFEIEDAKTPAGWRKVPIHSQLQPVMDRLIADSRKAKDEYVLAGLSKNKYGDRSNAVGKRFGYLKTALKHGAKFVFHSIRKTVVTQLERAGVPENVTADIVGHEKPTMTYGLYSGGNMLETLAPAIEKLAYPGWAG